MPIQEPMSGEPPKQRGGKSNLCFLGSVTAVLAAFTLFSNAISLTLPIFSMQVFDRIITSGNVSSLLALSLIAAVMLLCGGILEFVRSALLSRLSFKVFKEWEERVVHADFARQGASEFHLCRDLDFVRHFLTGGMTAAILDAPLSFVIIAIVFSTNHVLGYFTLVACLAITAAAGFGHLLTRSHASRVREMAGDLEKVSRLHQANQAIAQAMGLQLQLLTRLTVARLQQAARNVNAQCAQTLTDSVVRCLRGLSQVGIVAIAATMVIRRELQAGELIATIMFFARALAPWERIASGFGSLHTCALAFRRLSRGCNIAYLPRDRMPLPPLQGRVTVKNLYHRFPGAPEALFRGASFEIAPGKLVVVVGEEGQGKSTLASMIAGALSPMSGEILLDGSKLSDFDPEEIGTQIGYLQDEAGEIYGRISEYIARLRSPDPQAVVAAAQLSGAHAVIQRLAEGYNTAIDISFHRLSSGERRRLGLARAIYGNPRLLVLDDPTAFLDPSGSGDLVQIVNHFRSIGSTIVMVTREPSLFRLADEVIYVSGGAIRSHSAQLLYQELGPRTASDALGAVG